MADRKLSLVERLTLVMSEKGWDRADLVRVSGQSSSVVSQWLGKGSKEIKSIGSMEAAERISVESGFRSLWIAKGTGPRYRETSPTPSGAGQPSPIQSGSGTPFPLEAVRARVTITARANTAGGLVEDWSGVVGGTVQSPSSNPRAFAVKIIGDALHPAYRHGWSLICDPDATPRNGQPVLLQMRDGTNLIRELVDSTTEEVTTVSPLGGNRETINRRDVERVVHVAYTAAPDCWRPDA